MSTAQRVGVVAAMLAAHGMLAWGLTAVREVRRAVTEPSPLWVSIVPVRSPAVSPAPVQPTHVMAPLAPPVFPVIVAPSEPIDPTPLVAPAAPAQATAPVPVEHDTSPSSQPVAPTLIPASAAQYLEPPRLVYPRASRRAREAGRVVLRVYIDEVGMPREVRIAQSSGFPRLDEAACAAVLAARFKPYSDHGRALAGWALVPLSFDLEK